MLLQVLLTDDHVDHCQGVCLGYLRQVVVAVQKLSPLPQLLLVRTLLLQSVRLAESTYLLLWFSCSFSVLFVESLVVLWLRLLLLLVRLTKLTYLLPKDRWLFLDSQWVVLLSLLCWQ